MPNEEEQTTVRGIVEGLLTLTLLTLSTIFMGTTVILVVASWIGFFFGFTVTFTTCLIWGFVWAVVALVLKSLRGF